MNNIEQQIKELARQEVCEQFADYQKQLWQLEQRFDLLVEFLGVEFVKKEFVKNGRKEYKEEFRRIDLVCPPEKEK